MNWEVVARKGNAICDMRYARCEKAELACTEQGRSVEASEGQGFGEPSEA